MRVSEGIVAGVLAVFFWGTLAMGQAMGHDPGAEGRAPDERKTAESSLSAFRSEVEQLRESIEDMKRQLRQVRPSITAYKLPPEVLLCGEKIPVEDRKVWENLDREFLLTLNSEAQVLLWMKRARRYFPAIEKRLKEWGLPEDLKYVTITESSLRPLAVSSSNAAGIWQFIPSTGDKFGMRKNRGLDERFDFQKATEAALGYLKILYEEFKNWALTMAAYNAGENRIRKEIEAQKMANYYYLSLPAETERYVYKIAAAKIILSDPGRYGFYLDERDLYTPLRIERVQVEASQPLPLLEAAKAVGSYYKEIKELNPHLTEDYLPAGAQVINLPPETSQRFLNFHAIWKKNLESR